VCRKWRDASKHPRFTKRATAASRSSINIAIAESVAGGTVLLEPGYYQVKYAGVALCSPFPHSRGRGAAYATVGVGTSAGCRASFSSGPTLLSEGGEQGEDPCSVGVRCERPPRLGPMRASRSRRRALKGGRGN